MGWSLRGLPRRGCGVRLIGQVTAILGAIASANLVLILLDMARARSIDSPISADNARGKLQAGDASRRCDALIGVRRIRSGTRQPVRPVARLSPGPQHHFRNGDNAATSVSTLCRLFTAGQTVGQPPRTVADIGDPAHAPHPTLARIPTQRCCPDTEEVTGSNPVSPTKIKALLAR
jgi:hypothetical protein